jgi:soluble lytic murein transglycosylase-like protein
MFRLIRGILLALGLILLAAPATGWAGGEIYLYTDAKGNLHLADRPLHAGYWRYPKERLRPASRSELPPVSYGRTLASPNAWDGVISRAGRAHGVAPGLVKAMIHVESAFNRHAVSPMGAQGLMQLMPATVRALGVDDPFNPWQNIEGGTRHLGRLVRRFGGNLELALAAYNAGERAVKTFGGVPPYPETRQYVRRVLSLYPHYDRHFR